MKQLSPKHFLLSIAIALVASVVIVVGQDEPANPPSPQRQLVANERPNLLRELDLTNDQIQQIRRMNQARKPLMDDAAVRLRDAGRALDTAIYSDSLNEEDVAVRLKELNQAQAEMARLRFQNELGVRKILTPDQLIRFRALRERFARARDSYQQRQRPLRQGRPLQRLKQQRQQRRPVI